MKKIIFIALLFVSAPIFSEDSVFISSHSLSTIWATDPPSITFYGNSLVPIMELKHDGDIYVHGKLIENDKQVVDAMREIVERNGCGGKK